MTAGNNFSITDLIFRRLTERVTQTRNPVLSFSAETAGTGESQRPVNAGALTPGADTITLTGNEEGTSANGNTNLLFGQDGPNKIKLEGEGSYEVYNGRSEDEVKITEDWRGASAKIFGGKGADAFRYIGSGDQEQTISLYGQKGDRDGASISFRPDAQNKTVSYDGGEGSQNFVILNNTFGGGRARNKVEIENVDHVEYNGEKAGFKFAGNNRDKATPTVINLNNLDTEEHQRSSLEQKLIVKNFANETIRYTTAQGSDPVYDSGFKIRRRDDETIGGGDVTFKFTTGEGDNEKTDEVRVRNSFTNWLARSGLSAEEKRSVARAYAKTVNLKVLEVEA